jgi:uncharacterized membrane protein YphA (DoxX/SURF4 family)
MDDSMAQGNALASPDVAAPWKTWAGWVCAVLLALLFLVSGIWKLVDPLATEQRMVQMLFPRQIALLVAIGVGLMEAWGGVMILVPRWRRWGAWLCSLLLLAFMVYMAVNYTRLTGEDCSCFPWVKRMVGPGFFIGDAVMLLMAVAAGWWANRAESWRQAVLALGALVVFAGAVYGVTVARQGGMKGPAEITADGTSFSLRQGRVLVFFFDPECMHCFAGARAMSKYKWKDVRIVAVSTVNPQFGASFLKDTGLKVPLSSDIKVLRESFKFTDPPYAVALDQGREVQVLPFFDDNEPLGALRKLGWVE